MKQINPDTDIQGWAKWIVGMDFGGGQHPFAAVLCAYTPEIDNFFVVDGFRMDKVEALYHTKRIAAMCRGLRIPIAWPHDGNVREAGSGLALADIYRRLGAPMLPQHAQSPTGDYHTEPAIEEMAGFMQREQFYVASHMSEWGEEFLNYHRDENWKIVRLKDDLISATRYGFMMRRFGKAIDNCDTYGRAPGVDGAQYDPRPIRPPRQEQKFARGSSNHPAGSYDIFGN